MDTKPATCIPGLLFETSWEVCNMIGGIYTVLSTKAKTLQKLNRDKTIFIGPDVWSEMNPSPWFTETPVTGLTRWAKKTGLPDGITVRVGRWNIPGKPIAVLVKLDALYASKDEFYGKMWQLFGVDSLHAYGDYDEGCAFGRAAGMVIESILKSGFAAPKGQAEASDVVAHFDEWTTGMGLLYTKWKLPRVATVFTTHATSIGRSICGNNKPLYDQLKNYNGDQMARELNMEAKHSLEKAAAHQADAFTTVSDITAAECEQLLERKPDVVTPNGFEKGFVPSGKDFTDRRKEARKALLRTASALTGIAFDDSAFIVISSGRCEYRNKGLDLFLDVANRLRDTPCCRKVVAFVTVPAWSKEPRADLQQRLKSKAKSWDTPLPEPIITHTLNNRDSDPVVNRIASLGFCQPDPRVCVIYVPCYLNGRDGILDRTYYDVLIGADATVFPSYYEPWGYTPLESVAFGVPTVTTSLSGFGQWVLRRYDNYFDECGVNVIGRGDSNYWDVVSNISHSLEYLTCSDKDAAKRISEAARHTASEATWDHFIGYYLEAYCTAISKAAARSAGSIVKA